jgi:hypothetical protein
MILKTQETIGNEMPLAESTFVLLRNLIDYAGLFPPASLELPLAVANYYKYLQSEYAWILGRFILPVTRLGDFEAALTKLSSLNAADGAPWRLSVLLGADASADVDRICAFNERSGSQALLIRPLIQSVEAKTAGPHDIEKLSATVPPELETYFEVPLEGGEGECITAIANCGRRAKVRTGGETADKFPSPEKVVEFIRLCGELRVPFKATAGLHHPLRSRHPFTYQPGSDSGIMHGFLNVFLAAAFLQAGMEPPTALEVMKEESPAAFCFGPQQISWREHHLNSTSIEAARRGFSISFGSCSFTEPIEDLRGLHLL